METPTHAEPVPGMRADYEAARRSHTVRHEEDLKQGLVSILRDLFFGEDDAKCTICNRRLDQTSASPTQFDAMVCSKCWEP